MATSSKQVYHAVGKRKSSIARVYLQNGSGEISINERAADVYFPKLYTANLQKPFSCLKIDGKFDIQINVKGGGTSAQSEACMYGIAKALTLVAAENRGPLKKEMLLTRDSRVVERKKYGHKKARKSFQFSKR